MSFLPTIFAAILGTLRAAMSLAAARHPAQAEAINRAWSYTHRTARRFHTLYLRWQAGTLPPPRPATATTTTPPTPARAARPPSPRLPRRFAWFLRYNQDSANHGTQILALLDRPDMARFIAEVPRAGRLLRPLLHMLGTPTFATPLHLPPPRRIRASRAKPPTPAPFQTSQTPPRPIPAYVLAAARAWNRKRR